MKILPLISSALIILSGCTSHSQKHRWPPDICLKEHKDNNFQKVSESKYAQYNFLSHFYKGSRSVLPSYENFTKGEPAKNPREGASPVIRGVADFNLDGFEDIVVTYHETEQIAVVYYSDGKGGFQEEWLPEETRSRLFREASIEDFNGDGRPDIYGHTAPHEWETKGNRGAAAEPDFLVLNKEDGFFPVNIDELTNGNNHQGAVADFNGDGFMDVASFDHRQHKKKKRILYGTESGSFTEGESFPPSIVNFESWDLEAGDLNGDGRPDLILTGSVNVSANEIEDLNTVTIIINSENGLEKGAIIRAGKFGLKEDDWKAYSAYSECLSKKEDFGAVGYGGLASTELRLFDFDNDGDLDIFFAQGKSQRYENKRVGSRGAVIGILENRYPEFVDVSRKLIPLQPTNKVFLLEGLSLPLRIDFVDFNKDGLKDLLLTISGNRYHQLEEDHYPYLFIRTANGFSPVSRKSMGDLQWRSQVVALDLNGDGKDDLVSMRFARKSEKKYVFDTYLAW